MHPLVKTRRYDSSGRRSGSARRRALILDAARHLFVERGYQGTTLSAIAERAGVAVDTVYELVGRKPELLALLIETAVSGEDRAVPAEERPYVQDIHRAATAEEKLDTYARALPAIHARLAPLLAVLEAAARTEPALAELRQAFASRRHRNIGHLAAELARAGRLRVAQDEAADTIWATGSPDLYALLVDQRGWSQARYERWLADAWRRLLLDEVAE